MLFFRLQLGPKNDQATKLFQIGRLKSDIRCQRDYFIVAEPIETSAPRKRRKSLLFDDLRSDTFDVVELDKGHKKLGDGIGFDNSATIKLSKALPPTQRGKVHRELRAEMAKVLSDGRKSLEVSLRDLIKEYFAIFERPGTHDLLGSLCIPFVDKAMGILSGIQLEKELSSSLVDIFNPSVSFRRRRQLEDAVRKFFKDDAEGPSTCALAINTMGRDALIGALAKSMHLQFLNTKGQALNSIPFPVVPLATGVPNLWRVRTDDVEQTDFHECRLDQFEGESDDVRQNFFGTGKHTCLGKVHTLAIFQGISTYLAQCERVVLRTELETVNSYFLTVTKTFQVELG
jgi:hypothetical protein